MNSHTERCATRAWFKPTPVHVQTDRVGGAWYSIRDWYETEAKELLTLTTTDGEDLCLYTDTPCVTAS